jgi:membrane-associated phospholipid phosphatase
MKLAESARNTSKNGGCHAQVLLTSWLLAALVVGGSVIASAQTPADERNTPAPTPEAGVQSPNPAAQPPDFSPRPVSLQSLPRNLFLDQKSFWSTPFHMTRTDWDWAVPLVFTGLGLVASDTDIEKHVPTSPTTVSHAVTFSNAGLAAFVGAGGGLFVLGHLAHNDQQRETGLLSGEAAIDAFLDTEVFKYAAGRDRPFVGDGQGRFFEGGGSFPSQHAAVSWAIASVIAHEYPGPLTQLLAYGLAGGVSAARFAGQKHFASDVVIGSALGWYTGRQVFRSHSHYSDADIAKYGTFSKAVEGEEADTERKPRDMGSPYVPLDNWVYPAVDKLARLGYIRNAFFASRPWTRIQIANLVNDAKANLKAEETAPEGIAELELQLEREFAYELGLLDGKSNDTAKVESMYTRVVSISGQPLNDSYHFGQTIINNFGRPYEKGFNSYDGFSGYGAAGPFTLYVRGEYQHSPSAPGYSPAALQAIEYADQTTQPDVPVTTTVNRFTLLDTYAAANADGWNLSFGKQSLWWGPAEGGALMFSDNAEPIYMFRAARTIVDLPWILRRLGQVKLDFFFGKLSGNEFPARPLIHGEKISFKTTANWEFGFEITSELGGVGRALTAGAIWESYVATKSSWEYPSNRDPGKRTLGLDFSYRLPHLRNWATLYADALEPQSNPFYVDTSLSPLARPARTAIRSGLYMPRLPRLPKLDFRVESVYTDPPTPRSTRGDYVYWDGFYKDLYTNKNNLIGDWIGREGMGFQAWSNYWFTPRSSLQLGYRHAKVAKDFIPSGETLNDGSVKANWWFHRDLSLSGSVQYEKWLAPILAPTAQTNWTSTVELTFWPQSWGR